MGAEMRGQKRADNGPWTEQWKARKEKARDPSFVSIASLGLFSGRGDGAAMCPCWQLFLDVSTSVAEGGRPKGMGVLGTRIRVVENTARETKARHQKKRLLKF